MFFTKLSFQFIFLFAAITVKGEVDYFCELKWVAEGYGNVPMGAVAPSPGEFVARVNLLDSNNGNAWGTGRLLPEEGQTYVAYIKQGETTPTIFSSPTYEVLTNPDNCVLEWVTTFGGHIPQYSVSADEKLEVEFVGRGMVAGFSMAGGIHPSESALLVPFEGRVYPRRHYDALTSQYPKLNMDITEFIFPILDFRVLQDQSKETLIGQMELVSGMGDDEQLQMVQPITHTKNVKEVFSWEERQGWEGIANLSIDMDLWVGAPLVSTHFQNVDKQSPHKLRYTRDRLIVVDRTVTISGSGGGDSVLKGGGSYQVCSSVSMLNNFGVKFEALARVSAPLMRGDQLIEILRRTGRNILGEIEDLEEDGVVIAKIYGTLRGSFVTGVASHFAPTDQFGACNSVVKKSKHARNSHHHYK